MCEFCPWIYFLISFIFCLSLQVLLIDGEVKKSSESLRLVHIIYRHGLRTPMDSYPTDPNPVDSYHEGYSQLSNMGKKQMYNAGLILRQRYSNFLNDIYIPSEIYVRSSASDRTVMSALCVLAGLYPPIGDQIWNPNITWQPIPVYSVPKEYDKMLTSSICPTHQNYVKDLSQMAEYHKALEPHQDIIRFILHKAGMTEIDAKHLPRLIDSLNYQKSSPDRMILPSWVNTTILVAANEIADIVFTFKRIYGEHKFLLGGNLISHVIEQMNIWTENKTLNGRKIFMYSTHDGIIGPVLAILGNFHNRKIPMGSILMIELHELEKKYYVQMILRNSSDENGIILKLPDCTDLCPLEIFADTIMSQILNISMTCEYEAVTVNKKKEWFNNSSPKLNNTDDRKGWTTTFLILTILPCFIYYVTDLLWTCYG